MNLSELYQKGQEILEEKNLDFMLKGVETEFVMKHNADVLKKYTFLQRAINSISDVSTAVKILDVELKLPVIMTSMTAPIPSIREEGLIKVARALRDAGSMMWTGSPVPSNLRELADIGVTLCQTVKPLADRKKLLDTLQDAAYSGAAWVGVEIDAGQCTKVLDREMTKDCMPVSVEELREIRKKINIPFVLKGILSPWDAERALEAGADLIVVSNHGAHTLDFLPHPLEVIDQISSVVRGKIPIIIDSGFRRGTDVLKGLAMGAQAVGLGRPILWGLAADGEEGVKAVMTEIARELKRVMTMTGVRHPADAHPGILLRTD